MVGCYNLYKDVHTRMLGLVFSYLIIPRCFKNLSHLLIYVCLSVILTFNSQCNHLGTGSSNDG